jgi:hypothetical protein
MTPGVAIGATGWSVEGPAGRGGGGGGGVDDVALDAANVVAATGTGAPHAPQNRTAPTAVPHEVQ